MRISDWSSDVCSSDLSLHGAMCAVGYDDCEGDLLAHVRRMVGPDVPVGIEFDPHAHLSDAMLGNADVLIAYKEYPHTDFLARGEEQIGSASCREGVCQNV